MQNEPTIETIKRNKYVFPNSMAKKMAKIDTRTQMEAAMLSMTFMLVGLILTSIYLLFYGNFPIVFKILLIFNMICGFFFMLANLVTQYQSYLAFMEIKEFQESMEKAEKINVESMKGGEEDAKDNK